MAVMSRELRVQTGKETTWGTGVAPTVAMRGLEEFKIQPQPEVQMLEDMSLGLSGSSQAAVVSNAAGASYQGWASYEHLCYFLDGLLGEATPSGVGPYTYAYAAPTTTAPTCRKQTIVNSDETVGGYGIVSAVGQTLTLRGEPKMPLQMSGELIGHSAAADTLESLTAPAVNPIMMSELATIKWDTWAGTMGGTTLTSCYVRFFELTINANRTLRHCLGALTPSEYFENAWEGSLRVSLEFNADTDNDIDAVVAGTLTQKQVEFNFATSGNETLQLQFAGTIAEAPELFTDDDGAATMEIVLEKTYHSTFGNWFKANIDHDNATLT